MPYEEQQPEYPAFKMKAGAEGPFRKNFPSAFEQRDIKKAKDTVMKQRGLVHEGIPGGFGFGGDIDPYAGGSIGDLTRSKGPREEGPGQTETTWI